MDSCQPPAHPPAGSPGRRVAGRRLGEFTILGELGRGGMGVVYRARQESMGRIVALKTLPSFIGLDNDAVARFRREAEAAGRLSHPGIVPIYAIGEAEGVHYYAMELVEGAALSSLIEALAGRSPERLLGSLTEEAAAADGGVAGLKNLQRASVRSSSGARYAFSCAEVVADLASALTAAHRGMVIHRDVKPSNVLLRDSGQPILLDFGLARDEANVGLTASGDALGTPAYMAPEQARGEHGLDARVDIYGTGALLYEMLTLRPPFEGAHPGEIMRKIIEIDPVPVRHLNPRVPQDLETIVHTCLSKRPDDRYAAAEALEMDLRDFLAGREIVARKPNVFERLSRAMRRDRRSMLVALVVLFVSSVAFTIMGVVSRQQSLSEGERVLASAHHLMRSGRLQPAVDAYGHARGLLGDERVDAARREYLPMAFEALYADRRFGVLGRLLDTRAVADRDAVWRELWTKLEGRGQLRIDTEAASNVEYRYLAGSGQLDDWTRWEPGALLPLGEYLVRVRRADRATTVQHASIRRDVETNVVPFSYPLGLVGEGMTLVADRTGDRASLVQRSELTRAQYAALLATIDDPELRAELTPHQWERTLAEGDNLPVVYVSFAQARAVAALLGGHLLSEREFDLLATGGLNIAFPWGNEFSIGAVAADKLTMSGPAPVDHQRGVSPHDALNVVGNVAEILSPSVDRWRVPQTAGGHYNSGPDDVRCDARKPLDGILDQRQWAGFRIARYLPAPPSPTVEREVAALEKELFETGEWGMANDWRIHSDGSAGLQIRMVGRYPELTTSLPLTIPTPGFSQDSSQTRAADGHGRPIQISHSPVGSDQLGRVELRLARSARQGQQFQFRIDLGLASRSAIHAQGDSFSLVLPLQVVPGVRSMTRLRLPANARVGSVEPEPTAVHAVDGRTVIVWNHGVREHGQLRVPAIVRFRCDGGLTKAWPVRARAARVAKTFFDAIAGCDVRQLEQLLAPEFIQRPHGRGKAGSIDAYSHDGRRRDWFQNWRVLDVTAVGDVTMVWLELDWRIRSRHDPDRGVSLRRWPFRLLMRRVPTEADPMACQILEMAPAGGADTGRVEGAAYVNDALQVRVEPPAGVTIRRGEGSLTEMQLVCSPRDSTVSFAVSGLQGDVDDDLEDIRHRLTDGAWSIGEGRRIQGDSHGVFGRGRHEAEIYHWMFTTPMGEFVREEWRLLRFGQRWFLARARAFAATEREAYDTFRENRELFDHLAGCVSILDSDASGR